MDAAKEGLAASAEKKSTAEGDLATTSKDLAADIQAKAELHQDCMTKSEDFEAETKSRGEEPAAVCRVCCLWIQGMKPRLRSQFRYRYGRRNILCDFVRTALRA